VWTVDSVVYGCTDGSKVRQYGSILTITLTISVTPGITRIHLPFFFTTKHRLMGPISLNNCSSCSSVAEYGKLRTNNVFDLLSPKLKLLFTHTAMLSDWIILKEIQLAEQ